MIRLQDPELLPYEDHSVWQASWNDDEAVLARTPTGYWHNLVEISRAKRLLRYEMPVDVRLRILEFLNRQVDGIVSLEALQRVEPACDTAMKMLGEMKSLSIEGKCQIMRRWNTMASFCNLNPSLIEAMKLSGRRN